MTDQAYVATERLLLGSGPSPVPERVLAALRRPTIGHLDPVFGELMEQMKGRLRAVMDTENHATLAISGTGSAGSRGSGGGRSRCPVSSTL